MAELSLAELSDCCQLCRNISLVRFEDVLQQTDFTAEDRVLRQMTGTLAKGPVCTCDVRRPIYRLIKVYQRFLRTEKEDGMQNSCVWKSIKVFKSTFRASVFRIAGNLLARGESVNYLTGVETPLMAAIATYDEQLLDLLLDFGADVNLCDGTESMNALGLAILLNDVSLVELLLQHGGHVNNPCCGHLVPIQLAMNKNPAVSSLLVQYGADVHILATMTPSCELYTINCPLVIAILRKNTHLALLLLEHGEDVNQTYGDSLESPLHLAIREDDLAMVDILLHYNADLNRTSAEGHTPLGLALTLDCPNGTEIAKKLVRSGAQPNSKAIISFFQRIYTPLHIACFKGNFDFVKFLVEEVCSQDGLIGEEVEKAAGLSVQKMKKGFSVDRLLQEMNPVLPQSCEAPASRRSNVLSKEISFMLDFDWNAISRMKRSGLYQMADCVRSEDEYWTRSEVSVVEAPPTRTVKNPGRCPFGSEASVAGASSSHTYESEVPFTETAASHTINNSEKDSESCSHIHDPSNIPESENPVSSQHDMEEKAENPASFSESDAGATSSETKLSTSEEDYCHSKQSLLSESLEGATSLASDDKPQNPRAPSTQLSGGCSPSTQLSGGCTGADWSESSDSALLLTEKSSDLSNEDNRAKGSDSEGRVTAETQSVNTECSESAKHSENSEHTENFSKCTELRESSERSEQGAQELVFQKEFGAEGYEEALLHARGAKSKELSNFQFDSSVLLPVSSSENCEKKFGENEQREDGGKELLEDHVPEENREGGPHGNHWHAIQACSKGSLAEEKRSWRRICFLNQRTIDGSTPLFMAAFSGNVKIVDYLLKAGAGANFECTHGNFFHAAVLSQNFDLVKRALDLGCDINHINAFGNSPLILVSRLDLPEMCRLLVENGADMNARDRFRETPLLASVYFGCEHNARVLIQHGAALDLVDDNNTSAIYWAIFNNREQTLKLLLLAGVRFTPEILARYPRNIRVMHNGPLYRWLQHHVSNPRSLRSLCALRVRKHLGEISNGRSILGRIAALPLPTFLKDILMLKDCFEAIDNADRHEHIQ